MKALTKILAGGIAAAVMFGAAPAAAQYYPYGGNGYGYGNSGVSVTIGTPGYGYGNGYGGYGAYNRGYGVNQQAVVNQCTAAVQARLGGNMGYGYAPYGNAGGRVLGISRIEPRNDGGLTVRGVAASSGYGGYNQQPDLTFKCRTDYRGYVVSVDVQRAQSAYGYTPYGAAPSPYGSPYQPAPDNTGPYGYRRYYAATAVN